MQRAIILNLLIGNKAVGVFGGGGGGVLLL